MSVGLTWYHVRCIEWSDHLLSVKIIHTTLYILAVVDPSKIQSGNQQGTLVIPFMTRLAITKFDHGGEGQ